VTTQTQLNGIVLVNKPSGMTSHDVVDSIRRIAGTRRIGHTGTLDPLAEGLLIICIGPATRVSQFLLDREKVYEGRITLGAISSTYDAEGEIREQDREPPDEAETVQRAMVVQLGEQTQLPPPYSAVKVRGRKLYEYARNGEPIPQKPRSVHISRFDLLDYEPPDVIFEAKVSTGTYVRSMAHDMGLALGCGAYLKQLTRTRIGSFAIEQSLPLRALLAEPEHLPHALMSVTEALIHLPKVIINPSVEPMILNGRSFTTQDVLEFDGILDPGKPILVLNTVGRALSVVKAESDPQNGRCSAGENAIMGATEMVFKPLRVLARS